MKLTLGIMYAILLYGKRHDKDQVDVFVALSGVLNGEPISYRSDQEDSLKKEITAFKKCEIDKGSYINFSNKGDDLQIRFKQFIDNNIYSHQLETLLKYLIYIILSDDNIENDEKFNVLYNKKICKNQLKDYTTFEVESFLASIVQYIIGKKVPNKAGKETFKTLFAQEGNRAQWKFKGDDNEELIKDMPNIKIVRFESDINIENAEKIIDFSENEGLDPKQYYNLLVTNYCEKPKSDIFRIFIDRKRVIGNSAEDQVYNNGTALEILYKKKGDVCSIVESLPTLYMEEYKPKTEQKAYLGKIMSIHGKDMFMFKKLLTINMDTIVDNQYELDIMDDFELSRTHLAIKKTNIIKILEQITSK